MALYNEKGTITAMTAVESGTSSSGKEWHKQTIVISVEGWRTPYDKLALSVFGDKCVQTQAVKVGDKVEVSYSVSAKEYKGRWYNDISLFNIDRMAAAEEPAAAEEAVPDINEDSLDPQPGDLPF